MRHIIYNMGMKSLNLVISIFCLFLLQGFSWAPRVTLTIADKFHDKLDGTPEQKLRALAGFKKWPRHYNHSQEEIYLLIEKETAGRFHCSAFNIKTQARGLMQIREIALKDIGCGKEFFDKDGRLNIHKCYDGYMNIMAGCAYFRRCKEMAKAQRIGRFVFTRDEVALAYYCAGYFTWNVTIKGTLDYLQ